MKFFPNPVVLGLLLLPLAACQSLGPEAGKLADQPPVVQPLPPPFAEPDPSEVEMDGDMLFSYLVGELGSRRQELELAYPHYLHVARLAGDAYAAERATWIASFQGDLDRLYEATELWVSLAPNDSRARVKHAEALFREGRKQDALIQLEALSRIIQSRGGDPFTVGGGLLKNLVDKQVLLPLTQYWVDASLENAEALTLLGSLQLQAKDLDAAEASLRQAIALRPDWSRPWHSLVFVLLQQERKQDALELARDGVKKFPEETSLRLTYGRILHDNGAYRLALEQFRILQQQSPKDHKVRYMHGLLAVRVQAWDEARASFQALRNVKEFYDEASYYLAQVEEQQGNTQLAMGLYESVGQGNLYTDAGLRLALLQAQAGELDAARARLTRLRATDEDRAVELYVFEARLLWENLTDREPVFALYEQALAAHPDDADLLYSRALHAAELGRVAQLEADLNRILAEQPDHVDALNALGYTLADQTRRYQEAFGLISKAHAMRPDSPAVLDSLGWVHYRLGNYDQALLYLRQALDALQDPEIAAHLGEVLWVTGDPDQARRVWREGYRDDSDNPVLNAVMERFEVEP